MKPLDFGNVQIKDFDKARQLVKEAKNLIVNDKEFYMCVALHKAAANDGVEKPSTAEELSNLWEIINRNRPKGSVIGVFWPVRWFIDHNAPRRKRIHYLNRLLFTLKLKQRETTLLINQKIPKYPSE